VEGKNSQRTSRKLQNVAVRHRDAQTNRDDQNDRQGCRNAFYQPSHDSHNIRSCVSADIPDSLMSANRIRRTRSLACCFQRIGSRRQVKTKTRLSKSAVSQKRTIGNRTSLNSHASHALHPISTIINRGSANGVSRNSLMPHCRSHDY
jgi:hypothetical protein